MLDDFFTRALVAAIGAAIVAGPFGCVIVWRRLSYFGDTLAHSALLGVALGTILEIDATIAVFVTALVIALLLVFLQRQTVVPPDALLGLMAHGGIAIGLVMLALSGTTRADITGTLFGDILAVSRFDIGLIYIGGAVLLGILALVWTPLFAATVSDEIAAAENLAPQRSQLIFVLALACVVAIAMKIVGVLLITALLIVPAAAARRIASSPEQMVALAIAIGVAAVAAGLFGSLEWDTPSGPSIIVAALALFAAMLLLPARVLQRQGRKRPAE